MSVLVLQKCFQKNGERCRMEYSEGTAVAQKNGLEYLQGTAEGMEMVMCD
jgi:hypothetical protein